MNDYTYEVRSRGGMGRSAVWEWSVYGKDELLPFCSGEVTGAQSKADAAAREAIDRLHMKAKLSKKPKRPFLGD